MFAGLFRQLPIRMYTYSNLKAGLALVVYLNNQQVVASLTALSFREIVTCIMSSTPTADPPVNTEDNSTTSDQPVARLPAGLSAEDVQRIASAVAALVGRPSTSNNPLVSGLSQVSAPLTAGMQFVLPCRTT